MISIKVKYLGETDFCCLVQNYIYECIGEESGLYRIIDEEGFDADEEVQGYLYQKELFEIVLGDECLENADVADRIIKEDTMPTRFKIENWKSVCRNCINRQFLE